MKNTHVFAHAHVCVITCRTFILEEVAAVRRLACERCGHKLGQHGEVGGAVGTGCQGVEGVVASPPHGALVRHQVRRRLLNSTVETKILLPDLEISI